MAAALAGHVEWHILDGSDADLRPLLAVAHTTEAPHEPR
jgi:hypothetical protein